jgi:hypothetical protein
MNGSIHYEIAKAKTADMRRQAEQSQMIREAAAAVRATARDSEGGTGTAIETRRIVSRVRSLLRPRTA